MAVTFTRLKSGEWGLRSDGPLKNGQTVTVRKKDGSIKTMTVGKVVYSGGEVSLATIGEERASPQYEQSPAPSYSKPAYRGAYTGRRGSRMPSPQPRSESYSPEQLTARLSEEGRTALGRAVGFTRHDGAPELGQIISRKDGTSLMVVKIGAAQYMSAADAEQAEDFGHFGVRPGWHVSYDAIPVSKTAAEAAAAAAAQAKVDTERARALAIQEARSMRPCPTCGVAAGKWCLALDGEPTSEQGDYTPIFMTHHGPPNYHLLLTGVHPARLLQTPPRS